jgi:hypothetical protein
MYLDSHKAMLRQLVKRYSRDVGQVKRYGETVDNEGGFTTGWLDVGSPVDVRVLASQGGGNSQAIAGQVATQLSYTVTLPVGTDVRAMDQVWVELITGAGPEHHEYEVIEVLTGTDDIRTKAVCREVIEGRP